MNEKLTYTQKGNDSYVAFKSQIFKLSNRIPYFVAVHTGHFVICPNIYKLKK